MSKLSLQFDYEPSGATGQHRRVEGRRWEWGVGSSEQGMQTLHRSVCAFSSLFCKLGHQSDRSWHYTVGRVIVGAWGGS
jgi:hypothetical protein